MDRIRSGAAMLDLKVVSPQELIRQCVEPLEARLDAKGIALRIEVPQQRIAVRADSKRMKHVFGNILDNAIRYTPAGGTVTVSLHGTSGTHAQFSISDTGVGIADDAQMRVFERFYRAPGQSGESGTGLGLAIVREIVEAHGGRVWLESREGRGTTIHFVLPIEDASTLKELDHVSAN
jgi:signal transduction histidine kinase